MTRVEKGFTLYEINSRPWLYELRGKYGESSIATIADVPQAELDKLKEFGVHVVWLQGVWQLGEYGLNLDKTEQGRVSSYGRILPGYKEEDIIGSPYAVVEYTVSDQIGGDGALKEFRARLAALDIKLMLDLVPNHMAVDSVWMKDPNLKDLFVRRPNSGKNFNPHEFMADGAAHGKDPYCGAWPDTAQLNYFNPQLREEMTNVLLKIASMCDGMRVDMAMLLLNKVHKQNGWREPDTEFWAGAIKTMRDEYPDTLLMAEVYWGLDSELVSLGFDATYDKAVYDVVLSKHLDNIRGYIRSKPEDFLAHSTHFVENHDEPRAVAEFGGKYQANCAAAVLFTLPGIRLQFHGQWLGTSKTLDVHLRRHADEEPDLKNERYYKKLNVVLGKDIFRRGSWRMTDVYDAGRGDRETWRFLSWRWTLDGVSCQCVYNYSESEAGGHIVLEDVSGSGQVPIKELIANKTYDRVAEELRSPGLFVWLKPWSVQIFEYS